MAGQTHLPAGSVASERDANGVWKVCTLVRVSASCRLSVLTLGTNSSRTFPFPLVTYHDVTSC